MQLWEGLILFPLVKDDPVYLILNEIRKATFLSIKGIQTALITAIKVLLFHFSHLGTFLLGLW